MPNGKVFFIVQEQNTANRSLNTANENEPIRAVDNFILYPNPNNGSMSLFYELKNSESATLTIFDVNGKQVYNTQLFNSLNRLEIVIKELMEGIYYYKVESKGGILKADKLIIIK